MDELVRTFLDHLRFARNYSLNTIQSYRRDLQEFLNQLGDDPSAVKPSDIDHITIRDFLGALHERGNSRSSMARKLAAVRSFFRFLHREGLIASNPARLVRTPRQARRNPAHQPEGSRQPRGNLVSHKDREPARSIVPAPGFGGT